MTPVEPVPAAIPVTAEHIRKLYRDNGFHERILNREFEPNVVSWAWARPGLGFPAGSRTMMVELINRETRELEGSIHQYVAPDGTILASGEPDPETLRVDGQMYYRVI